MKLSIFLQHLLDAVTQSGKTLDEVLREAKDCGIEGVDCDLAELDNDAIRTALKRAGISVSGIYVFLDYRLPEWEKHAEHLLCRAQEVQAHSVMPLTKLLREDEDRLYPRDASADGIAKVC